MTEVFASILTHALRTVWSPGTKNEKANLAKGPRGLLTHWTFHMLSIISF